MSVSHPASAQQPPSAIGRVRGLLVLLAMLVGTAWLCGGSFLLTRRLWMDEIHSWLIVTDTNQAHAMQALADGADFNPPTWFLVTRWLSTVAPMSEGFLRLLSLAWMMLSLGGLYFLLSRHFSARVCLTAILLAACHPLLIHHSTEIRFYGFWCAAVTWLCCVLQWKPATIVGRRLQMVFAAALAAIIATCHYFGILSLFIVAMPLVLTRTADWKGRRLAAVVLFSGCTFLGCCLPFLSGQKAALTRPTWVTSATLEDCLLFLWTLFPAWQVVVCVSGMLLSLAVSRRSTVTHLFQRLPAGAATLAPCLCLAMMPLVIFAVEWLVQPALVTRYAIVGILGFVPLFAVILFQCSANIQRFVLAVSLVALGCSMNSCRDNWNAEQSYQLSLIQQLQRCPEGSTVLFEDRCEWMPVLHHNPELRMRCLLADFSDSQMVRDSSLRIVQRDVGRKIQKWYPLYRMQAVQPLSGHEKLFVVPYADQESAGLHYDEGYEAEEFTSSILRLTATPLKDPAHQPPRVSVRLSNETPETGR